MLIGITQIYNKGFIQKKEFTARDRLFLIGDKSGIIYGAGGLCRQQHSMDFYNQ